MKGEVWRKQATIEGDMNGVTEEFLISIRIFINRKMNTWVKTRPNMMEEKNELLF